MRRKTDWMLRVGLQTVNLQGSYLIRCHQQKAEVRQNEWIAEYKGAC